MKKIKYLISILILISIILSAQIIKASTLQKQNRSKQLIERYNELRNNRSLPNINSDSIIDDAANEILIDKRYRKLSNEFDEDSIRLLFFNKGVIDYKFEAKEFLDKDTDTVFNAFLFEDTSSNILIGYSRSGNKHLLIKIKSYLKYDFGDSYIPRINIPSNKNTVDVKTDSIVYYVKWIVPGKYYYHYLNHIPRSSESVGSNDNYEVKKSIKKNPFTKGFDDTYPNMVLTSVHPDMYLIVTSEKNEIVAILK